MAGVDTDDLYDIDVMGDGPVAAFMRRSDGTPLRYAAAKYGQPGDAIGFREADGSDMGPRWAKKGTAGYAPPVMGFNGGSFNSSITALSSSQGTVTATLFLSVRNDGTWDITQQTSAGVNKTLASGTWLPAGHSASEYSAQFAWSVTTNTIPANSSISSTASNAWASLSSTQTLTQTSHQVASTATTVELSCSLQVLLKQNSTGSFNTTRCTFDTFAQGQQ